MPIIRQAGKLTDHVYMNDTKQYHIAKLCSSFLYWDGKVCIVIDVGTSNNVHQLFSTIRKLKIPYKSVQGIIVSHYHFDHAGGTSKLWRRMRRKNPNFKIYVPKMTHDKLQDAKEHLRGAKTTFGIVGTMKPIPEEGYVIVDVNKPIPIRLANNNHITLLPTPGHSPDHCCPIVWNNEKIEFLYGGEACGSLFQGENLLSVPTSMPPNFKHSDYLDSLNKVIELSPPVIGFCHFGAIKGQKEVLEFLKDDKETVTIFREEIIKAYSQHPTTKHVIEQTRKLWNGRFDPNLVGGVMKEKFVNNLALALTYGPLIDLGYRQPKYEKRIV